MACSLSLSAQQRTLDRARVDYYKQTITIYSDSTFKTAKVVSLDFQKFKLLGWNGLGWKAIKSGLLSQSVDTVYVKDDQFIKTPEYREVLESYDPKAKQRHEAYYKSLVKKYGSKIGGGMYFGVPTIGMTTRQFFMCRDYPDKINTTETDNITSEQYVYNNSGEYYYFTNGKLTAIQN
jgi:hypothetical protein